MEDPIHRRMNEMLVKTKHPITPHQNAECINIYDVIQLLSAATKMQSNEPRNIVNSGSRGSSSSAILNSNNNAKIPASKLNSISEKGSFHSYEDLPNKEPTLLKDDNSFTYY